MKVGEGVVWTGVRRRLLREVGFAEFGVGVGRIAGAAQLSGVGVGAGVVGVVVDGVV